MNTKTQKIANIFTWLCLALFLVILVLQFMPYWTLNGEQYSIQEFVWMSFDAKYRDLGKAFSKNVADYTMNGAVGTPILILVSGVIGAYFCITKREEFISTVCPLICGIGGVVGYLTSGVLQLGASMVLHLALCAVLAAVALALFFLRMRAIWQKNEKYFK